MINNTSDISIFEKDSLANFEKILQGYRKAKQSSAWMENVDTLVEKMTHLPTDPFSCKLMKLFNYNYLVLTEPIEVIIEKSLKIREQMKHTERYVDVIEQYYSIPFLPKNTYLKRLEVYNNEGLLCYKLVGKLRIKIKSIFQWMLSKNKGATVYDFFTFKQKTYHYRKVEIYYYSPFIDLSTTNTDSYYNFFCDYYGKLKFIKYVSTKDKVSTTDKLSSGYSQQPFTGIQSLTSSQQVLWVYFFFRLIGLKLRVNVEVAVLTRFLHLINNVEIDDYKNSYYYKLLSKAPYVKEDRNLLRDLETIRHQFQQCNLPLGDIEKEIINIVAR